MNVGDTYIIDTDMNSSLWSNLKPDGLECEVIEDKGNGFFIIKNVSNIKKDCDYWLIDSNDCKYKRKEN